MSHHLHTVGEVAALISEGKTLLLSGDESLLDQLPDGNWIGGTIPYFMTTGGGLFTKDKIYVNDITDLVIDFTIESYDENSISQIVTDSFENGFTFLILPALTDVWSKYALESPEWQNLYVNPIVGWVSGVKYEDFGKQLPKTYVGNKSSSNKAAVLHASISMNKVARAEIINVYEQGDGDNIFFEKRGFGNNECLVNGEKRNLYDYLIENDIDETLPLVANYAGARLNVGSIWDKEKKRADLFAPVFPETVYRVAKHRDIDYAAEFKEKLSGRDANNMIFSCTCLFNYVNFGLEGKNIANVTGPVTFGEIAYHVVNQTFVYLVIE
jgi:hypothetical protein